MISHRLSCVFSTWPQEAAGEKGILEQSEITLVSVTDEDTTITEEEEVREENNPDEEGHSSKETEVPVHHQFCDSSSVVVEF